jgi:hypothetical protein
MRTFFYFLGAFGTPVVRFWWWSLQEAILVMGFHNDMKHNDQR